MVSKLIGHSFNINAKKYVISSRWNTVKKKVQDLIITHNSKFVSSLFMIHKTRFWEFYLFDRKVSKTSRNKQFFLVIYDVRNDIPKGKYLGTNINKDVIINRIKFKIRSLGLWF